MPDELDEFEAFNDDVRRMETARKERDRYKAQRDRLATELELSQRRIALLESANDLRLNPPTWTTQTKRRKHQSILVTPLSDLHLDQVVDLQEMRGANQYDRKIALLRLRRWAESVVDLGHHHLTGTTWDGIVIPVLGDLYPGDIHQELRETNEDYTLSSVEFWADHLVAALKLVADAYGKIHLPWVVGNHGRTTHKPVYAGRASSNVDWLTGRIIARELKSDKRFTFDVPTSMHTQFSAYGTRFQCTHGDTFKGGGGIGGIWPPIMRGNAKMAGAHQAIGQPFDHMLIGHFHQLVFGPQFTINGSLVGYDQFAFGLSFTPEPAQQSFLVVHPEHGITVRGPIHCQDPKREGWGT